MVMTPMSVSVVSELEGASVKAGVELNPVLELLLAGPSAGWVSDQTAI